VIYVTNKCEYPYITIPSEWRNRRLKGEAMNKSFIRWATILFGIAFLVAGALVAYQGYHTRGHMIEDLTNERLVVQDPNILLTYEGAHAPEGVEVPEVTIDDAMEADAQARVIREHTMGITGGKTYSEMDREDPARATYITSLTLQTALHIAHMGLELSLFVMGVGMAFMGIGAATLVIGLPLVNKVLALK
jgi:hypothetical protein